VSKPGAVEWVLVAELSELARRKKKQVVVGVTPIALFLVGDRVFALHDVCVHKQRSLSKGAVLHGRVICPGHQWAFDPATGEAADQSECQPTYDVRVADGKVYVDPRQRLGRADIDAAPYPPAAVGVRPG
jgi:nitrite reductase/ring-hydroxylating ferredoxin subunit